MNFDQFKMTFFFLGCQNKNNYKNYLLPGWKEFYLIVEFL